MSDTPQSSGTTTTAARQAISILGTIGILALIAAVIALAVSLWAGGDAAVIGGLLFGPLINLGALFTVAWLATTAVVDQLAHR